MSNKVWTREACFNEARKYNTLQDFREQSESAYNAALSMKIVNKFTWLERQRIIWTEELIKEEIEKGHYVSKADLRKRNPALASAARRKGLLEHFFKNVHQSYNYKDARNVAIQFKHKRDFQKAYPNMYARASTLGWLDTFEWFIPKSNPYTNNMYCVYMRMNEGLKIVYVGITMDFKARMKSEERKKDRVYQYFKKYGVSVPPGVKYLGGVSLSVQEAQSLENKVIEWFKDNGWTVLNKAKTGVGYSSIGSIAKKWTPFQINKAANKCKDIKEFQKKYPGAYQAACRLGIDLTKYYTYTKPGYWKEKENCRLAAQDCKNATEFLSKYPGAYAVSRKNKWIKEFFPIGHYVRTILMLSEDGIVLKEFTTFKKAAEYLGIKDASNICKCCKGKKVDAYGYKWKYA